MANPFSHLEDDKLMELYKNGENMAFEVIYSRYKNRVYLNLAIFWFIGAYVGGLVLFEINRVLRREVFSY